VWIIPSSIRLDFAAASACSKKPSASAANTSDSEHELRVSLSGKVTPRPRSWPGWKNRAWSLPLFGAAIWEASTGSRFADWWTSSALACRVSPTASPGSKKAMKTKGATGKTATGQSSSSCESLPSVSPPWCSAKTSLPGFQEDGFDLSEKNYADWVTRSKARSLSLRRALARVIGGKDALCWPTVCTAQNRNSRGAIVLEGEPHQNHGTAFGLEQVIEMTMGILPKECKSWDEVPPGYQRFRDTMTWPSPRSEDSESCGNHPGATDSLTGAVAGMWQTPRNCGGADATTESHEGAANLKAQIAQWATPAAHERASLPREVDHGIQLANQADAWPTPNSQDHKWTDLESRSGGASLSHATETGVFSHSSPPDPLPTGAKSRRTSTRRLNPVFVCWLMGMPHCFWTRAEPTSFGAAETASWRSAARSLLLNLCGKQ